MSGGIFAARLVPYVAEQRTFGSWATKGGSGGRDGGRGVLRGPRSTALAELSLRSLEFGVVGSFDGGEEAT